MKIVPFLKKKSVGYRPKQSKVLTREQINLFLKNAEDNQYLLIEEDTRRKWDNNSRYLTIPDTKTDKKRVFTITNVNFKKMYQNMQPFDLNIMGRMLILYKISIRANVASGRLFLKYHNGKYSARVVGVNQIGEIPSTISNSLGLPDSEAYTGHCYRRSSVTLLTNSDEDLLLLKRHGGWKSSTVAEGYGEDSLENKNNVSNLISGNG
ncbi:hypothetical protein NQ315_014703 [Exocentrus adspersus]|uniref:Tyr recombinase domain-containing protein n=1 Tax=Exocentrus adspersus TaxID=1586481 RepID=A0AAV8V6E3_9CUCU|nr:hypothetical protein NQ315_014703 [Exocentrus adspersus]